MVNHLRTDKEKRPWTRCERGFGATAMVVVIGALMILALSSYAAGRRSIDLSVSAAERDAALGEAAHACIQAAALDVMMGAPDPREIEVGTSGDHRAICGIESLESTSPGVEVIVSAYLAGAPSGDSVPLAEIGGTVRFRALISPSDGAVLAVTESDASGSRDPP